MSTLTPEQEKAAEQLGRAAAQWLLSNPHSECEEPSSCMHQLFCDAVNGGRKVPVKEPIKVGDLIQYVSGIGPIYEVVRYRPQYSDFLALTIETDPRLIRVINQENWKVV